MRSRPSPRLVTLALAGAAAFAAPRLGAWNPTPQEAPASLNGSITLEQMRSFLLKADVVRGKQLSKGITGIFRLTLSDGALTHDAAFQPIDESKSRMELAGGRTEINFRDSWHFNIAGYEIAKLLDLDSMMPVTVERKWSGKTGSLSWWLDVQLDEGERLKRNVQPPNVDDWNRQMHRMRVFAQLVYDTDRNLGNVLISADWKLYMIDFTRAFRIFHDLENPKNLTSCDRQLLDRLRQLQAAEVEARTKGHLNKLELKGIMARRDKIVTHFEKLVAQLGEKAVLY